MKFNLFFHKFLKPKPKGLTRDEVVAVTKEMGLHRGEAYQLPTARCPRWLIIRWPDECASYFGTLMVESASILDWAKEHAKGVYSSDNTVQGAREYLPTWLEAADQTNETSLLPDPWMLSVLQPYDEDFIEKATIRMHCVQCGREHSTVERSFNHVFVNGSEKAETVWTCPAGHTIKYEVKEPIRFF